jgi:hypothetical protein
MESCFWADATIRYGAGPEWSPAQLLDAWLPVAGACIATQHHVFNHSLDVEADIAYAESYYIAVFAPGADLVKGALLPFCGSVGSAEVAFQGGRYVDRLERRDGEWRIALRQVCGDWFATADGSQTMALRQSIADDPRGSGSLRNREDPSYGSDPAAGTSEPLDELLAVDAIRDCVFRYARGIDRLDRDLLASAFSGPDDQQEFMDCVFARGQARSTQSHYITNLRVSVDGASGGAEAYFLSVHRDTGMQVDLIGGRYVLEVIQESGDWRIAKRTTLGEWHAVGDGQYLDAFQQATGNKSWRSREDASYHPPVTRTVSRTVDDLVEREGVRDCLARYARGVDRLDRELIQSSFVEPASQFIDYMFGQADIRPVQNHYWTNLRIELADDLAFVEAYYVSVLGYVEGASHGLTEGTISKDDMNLVGGRYTIPLARADNAQWAMKARGNIGDWHAVVNGSGLSAYLHATGNGGRPRGSRDDPSYIRT